MTPLDAVCSLSEDVPLGRRVLVAHSPAHHPHPFYWDLIFQGQLTLHSPSPSQISLHPTAIVLHRVVLMLLAHGVQHGQQLGLRGCGQSHGQKPAQCAPRQHRQL